MWWRRFLRGMRGRGESSGRDRENLAGLHIWWPLRILREKNKALPLMHSQKPYFSPRSIGRKEKEVLCPLVNFAVMASLQEILGTTLSPQRYSFTRNAFSFFFWPGDFYVTPPTGWEMFSPIQDVHHAPGRKSGSAQTFYMASYYV